MVIESKIMIQYSHIFLDRNMAELSISYSSIKIHMVKFCGGTWSGHLSSSRKRNDVEKSLFMYFF